MIQSNFARTTGQCAQLFFAAPMLLDTVLGGDDPNMALQDLWAQANAFLAPLWAWISAVQNIPIVGLGLLVIGIATSVIGAAGKRKERQALIDDAVEAVKRELSSKLTNAGIADNPEQSLRDALTQYLDTRDSRGPQIAKLLSERRPQDAQRLAAEIASDCETRAKPLADAAAKVTRAAAQAWVNAGAIAYLNDPKAAIAAYEKAQRLGLQDGELLVRLGNLYLRTGRLRDAEQSFLLASDKAQKIEVRAAASRNLGVIAYTQQNYEKAIERTTGALSLYRSVGDRWGVQSCLTNLGNIDLAQGNLPGAERLYKEALDLGEKDLVPRSEVGTLLGNLAVVYRRRGDLNAASACLGRSLGIFEALSDEDGVAGALGNLGNVAADQRDLPRAETYYSRALATHEKLGNREAIASSLGNLGDIARERGDTAKARELYMRVLGIYQEMNAPNHQGAVRAMANLANLSPG